MIQNWSLRRASVVLPATVASLIFLWNCATPDQPADDELIVVAPKPTVPPVATPTTPARRDLPSVTRLLEDDTRLWRNPHDKQALLKAIDFSLRYLGTQGAAAAYRRQHPRTRITRSRVQRSLRRFRTLLQASRSPAALRKAVEREFILYDPVQRRAVTSTPATSIIHFTGYYEPIYLASRVRTSVYRYPIFRLPSDFSRWSRPHPTRVELEGRNGLTIARRLQGAELVWLKDRLEAYLIHVQGSARLRLTDGKTISIGYAGSTAWPYTSMGRQLVKDGKIPFESLTLQTVIEHFRATPEDLNNYLPHNRRFIFFRPTHGAPVSGAIGLPLTAERSIATDKSMMPPGALVLIQVQLTNPYAAQVIGTKVLTRYVLDQDAGAAIKGAARVDIFMGTGTHAGKRAGAINSMGRLYYLLLKNG